MSINGSDHYRSVFYTVFPFYGATNSLNTSSSSWTSIGQLYGQWSTGHCVFQKSMYLPSGFTDQIYCWITGGSGSSGTANLRWKMDFNSGTSIADRSVVYGWYSADASFHDGAVPAAVSGETLRSWLSSSSTRSATFYFRNLHGSGNGNVGVSRLWVEQRVLLT